MSSLVITVPINQLEAANAALDAKGYGPNNLSIPMRGPVAVEDASQATHYGCHWFADDIETIKQVVIDAVPEAEFLDSETGLIGFDLFDSQAGDYFYVPVDPRLAVGLSYGLYSLKNPTGQGRYVGVIEHPSGAPEAWPILEFRQNDIVPISLAGNGEPLIDVLRAFVQGGGLTQEELDGIVRGVTLAAGHSVRLAEFIPASWQQYVMTREQAEEAGYFS